jgi:hypothetical protein
MCAFEHLTDSPGPSPGPPGELAGTWNTLLCCVGRARGFLGASERGRVEEALDEVAAA